MQGDTKECTKCGETGEIGKDFRLRKDGKAQSWCNRCISNAGANWSNKHPERRRVHNRKQHYTLSSSEYDALFAQQGGACAICQKTGGQLTVDHCHKSGKVRALLCIGCHSFIGKLETYLDQLDIYLHYIQHYQAEE